MDDPRAKFSIDAEIFRQLRRNSGHSQRSLAEKLGLSEIRIKQLEQGVAIDVLADTARGMAEFFGVTISDLEIKRNEQPAAALAALISQHGYATISKLMKTAKQLADEQNQPAHMKSAAYHGPVKARGKRG